MISSKQVSALHSSIDKYLKLRYSKLDMLTRNITDTEYLDLFEQVTEPTEDLFLANFILPDGRLRRFRLDLTGFEINDVYKVNFGITNENIYDFINLRHDQIEYLGFNLDKLLDLGCIRVGNNKVNGEIYLHMNLIRKLSSKVIDVLEDCLIKYNEVIIEFLNLEVEVFSRYSSQKGDTIKDIIKDMNQILISREVQL